MYYENKLKTTKGKATKSLERQYTEMVQWDWDPDDRTTTGWRTDADCIPIRWQKASTKVK